jgi:hypothetical protein
MRAMFVFVMAATVIALVPTAQAKVLITINKSTQSMSVAVDGAALYNWAVSTGRSGHDTPNGDFRAFRMERDHHSKEWDDAPMPHSIFFTQGGHAIHGSYEIKKIGTPASAGCVRLAPEHAKKLFALIEEQGVLNTNVKIVGDLQIALARGSRRSAAAPARPRPRYSEAPPSYYVRPLEGTAPRSPYYVVPPEYDERHPYPHPRHYHW